MFLGWKLLLALTFWPLNFFCAVIDAKKPSVAAIQGLALGSGLELVMVYGNDCLSVVVLCLVWKVWEVT